MRERRHTIPKPYQVQDFAECSSPCAWWRPGCKIRDLWFYGPLHPWIPFEYLRLERKLPHLWGFLILRFPSVGCSVLLRYTSQYAFLSPDLCYLLAKICCVASWYVTLFRNHSTICFLPSLLLFTNVLITSFNIFTYSCMFGHLNFQIMQDHFKLKHLLHMIRNLPLILKSNLPFKSKLTHLYYRNVKKLKTHVWRIRFTRFVYLSMDCEFGLLVTVDLIPRRSSALTSQFYQPPLLGET